MLKSTLIAIALICTPVHFAHSEETTTEKVQEGMEDASKNIKKAGRAAADKACPIVNGKVDCAMKKGKHKAQNAADEVKDKADDVKKKVD